MTKSNVKWLGSAERFKFKNHSERPFYQDEQQFYLFHPPMPTENGKLLQEYFNERKEIEEGKNELRKEQKKLVDIWSGLQKKLSRVQRRHTNSIEEEMKKQEEIASIQEESKKVVDDIFKIKKSYKKIDKKIDSVNEKINEMVQIVIEDEHKLAQKEQELEKEKNEKKVESLIEKL